MSLDAAIKFFEDNAKANKTGFAGPHFYEAVLALKEKKRRQEMPDTAPYSNNTTSKKAAEKIACNLSGLRKDVLDFITSQGDRGATGSEIAEALSMNLYTAKPRCTELRDAGFIIDSGSTRINNHGNDEIVWLSIF